MILVILALIAVPKGIDLLFDWYCKPFSLHNLDAKDILSYAGVIIGFGGVFATILLSVRQFKLQNRPFIIPQNQRLYFYANAKFDPCFLSTRPDLAPENLGLYARGGPSEDSIQIQLKNIGNGTAADFSVEIDYNQGKDFTDLVMQLGCKDCGFSSNFKPDEYNNAGIFNAGELKTLPARFNLTAMILKICEIQYRNNVSKNNHDAAYNKVSLKGQHKIACITIRATDIMDTYQIERTYAYDIYLEVSDAVSIVSENGLYSEAFLTFKRS